MTDWKGFVNVVGEHDKISNMDAFLTERKKGKYCSPIDRFYVENRCIISLINENASFLDRPFFGPLLFVGMMSNVENYMREILAESIKIDPICKRNVMSKTISYGSATLFRTVPLEDSIYERVSFSSPDKIKAEVKHCFNYDIPQKELTAGLLEEYNKLCQMRHAIVHSDRRMAAHSIIEVGDNGQPLYSEVKMGYDELQKCANICTTLVQSINIMLFKIEGKRWALDWREMKWWNKDAEKKMFDIIWSIFFSEINKKDLKLLGKTKVKCKRAIIDEYQIK